MPQLFLPEIIENTAECYHLPMSPRIKVIYGGLENTLNYRIGQQL